MTRRKADAAASFYDQVHQALNHFADDRWLGENSPLAAPYFLGKAIANTTRAETAVGRGEALQGALLTAAAALWPGELPANSAALLNEVTAERQQMGNKGAMYHFLLLELRHFRRYFRPVSEPQADDEPAISDFLSISRASFFNHLKSAEQALGDALLRHVRPTLRLEQPVLQPASLVGRDSLLNECLADLRAGKSVALSGPGGVGKTALGAAMAGQWAAQPVFWFTLRPAFNDHLNSLLFSLGHFLHRQGASSLWQQLVAGGGKAEDPNLALAQLRGDLQTLPSRPLVCLDEVDVIYTEPEAIRPAHVQLREFMASLCQLTPVLLMGQQHLFQADVHYRLEGLPLAQLAEFFARARVTTTGDYLRRIHTYTGGNPRLLQLCLTLQAAGLGLDEIAAEMPHTPALHALWERLWHRLQTDERELLRYLSVFRSPAPADGWTGAEAVLGRLLNRGIVQQDAYGGLFLLPIFRELVYDDRRRFPAEARDRCHLKAAGIRAARGEYTAAAYHFHQAGEIKNAIRVWFPRRQLEVQRGLGGAAQALFQQISSRSLPSTERQALALLRAELFQLAGEAEDGLRELRTIRWPAESESTVQARLLEGDFLNILGQPRAALAQYEEGLAVTSRLLNRRVQFHHQRGVIHFQQKELAAAWREAQLALFEATQLQGMVQDEHGHYEEALRAYVQALAYAESAGYEKGIAQAHWSMATTLGRQARLDEALQHARQAMSTYERIGDRLSQEKMNAMLAATYFQAGRYQSVIDVAEPTVAFFEEAKMPYWVAVIASNLAEAYYETGQLERAEEAAHKVLRLEETQTHPYALYTLGLVARARADLAQAERFFGDSQASAQQNGDRYMEAYAWRALGEARLARGEAAAGRAAIETALQQFTAIELRQEIEPTRRLLVETNSGGG